MALRELAARRSTADGVYNGHNCPSDGMRRTCWDGPNQDESHTKYLLFETGLKIVETRPGLATGCDQLHCVLLHFDLKHHLMLSHRLVQEAKRSL